MGMDISRLHVRRSAFMNASPARVWQEFTDFERFAAWYGTGHTLEQFTPELGAEVLLSVTIDGERRPFGGPIVVFEPGRELSYDSNWHPPHQWTVPTFHTIRLSPLYEGTHVEMFHHGFERLGAEAGQNLDGYEQGWDNHHLLALREIIEA